MLAVLAIGGMGGVADVSVNLHTRAPSCRAAVGGLAHSYATSDKAYYVKLLRKSFKINDLQAA